MHPYFHESFKDFGEPPKSETIFDWSWDNFELTRELLQTLIYMESLCFHPEQQQEDEGVGESLSLAPLSNQTPQATITTKDSEEGLTQQPEASEYKHLTKEDASS